VYLVGASPDLARLQRELSAGPVVVAADDSGTFLQAEAFAQLESASEVLTEVGPLLALLNGMAALNFGGHSSVGFAGAIARNNERHIFVTDQVRVTDDLSDLRASVEITADGVVSDTVRPRQTRPQALADAGTADLSSRPP